MKKLNKISLCLLAIALTQVLNATPNPPIYIYWTATSDDEMGVAQNWTPNDVPDSTETAVFDSTYTNVNNTPTATADFNVSAFYFPSDASYFSFDFPQYLLTFNGPGITGTTTNVPIAISNINNPNTPSAPQLYFNSPSDASSGSATITISNMGIDTSNEFSNLTFPQMSVECMGNFYVDDNAHFAISNEGTNFNGSEVAVGVLSDKQISFLNPTPLVSAGDQISFCITNEGINSNGNGVNVGKAVNQFYTDENVSFSIKDQATFTVRNKGTNNDTNSDSNNEVGYITDNQFLLSGNFTGGNQIIFDICNEGKEDSNNVNGNRIGYVTSDQLNSDVIFFAANAVFLQVGDDATFRVQNKGCNTNTNDSANNHKIGYVEGDQTGLYGGFTAGDRLHFKVSNQGLDESNNLENNFIGYVQFTQFVAGSNTNNINVGDDTVFEVYNNGHSTNTNDNANGHHIGYVGGGQSRIFGSFVGGDRFHLCIYNDGLDESDSLTANVIGFVGGNQFGSDNGLVIGNDSTFNISNKGYSTNTNDSGNSHLVGYVQTDQGTMSIIAGNRLHLSISNEGINKSNNFGYNSIGCVGNVQLQINTTSVGDHFTLDLSNKGVTEPTTYNYDSGGGNHSVGVINGHQMLMGGYSFTGGGYASFQISNKGHEKSDNISGNHVGCVLNGYQIGSGNSVVLGDHSIFNIINKGENQNTNHEGGAHFVGCTQYQIGLNGSFKGGDELSFNICNEGLEESNNFYGNQSGYITYDQLQWGGGFIIGEYTNFKVINRGHNKNNNSESGNHNIGYVGRNQFITSNLSEGKDHIFFNVCNEGFEDSNSLSSNSVGYAGNQFALESAPNLETSLTIGNNVFFNISNKGYNKNTNSLSNSGSHLVGYVSVDQVGLLANFKGGDYISFNILNEGIEKSNNYENNKIGYVNNAQFESNNGFSVGDYLTLNVCNEGHNTNTNSGNSHDIGYVNNGQVLALGNFSVGNHAFINIKNKAYNDSNATGFVGSIGSNQASLNNFTSGDCLLMRVCNELLNINNNIAISLANIDGDQIQSNGSFVTGNNASIIAYNEGTVNSQLNFNADFYAGNNLKMEAIIGTGGLFSGPQMYFGAGFEVGENATLTAINNGDYTGDYTSPSGIWFNGNTTGGDIEINLENTPLTITMDTVPYFMISGLNGNSTSEVQSTVPLIINSNADENTYFAGSIAPEVGFAGFISLTKEGLGKQTLSGVNTYGNTTINQGELSLAFPGSLNGDVVVNPTGIFSGSGTVSGSLVNNGGTVQPDDILRPLIVEGDYTQDSQGIYAVQVNGAGQNTSLTVGGDADLAGFLKVSSLDGTYAINQPYTILNVTGDLSNSFALPVIINPLLSATVTYDRTDPSVSLLLQTNFGSAAKTKNQAQVAKQFDNIGMPNADTAIVIDSIISLPFNKVGEALNQMSGNQYTTIIDENEYSDRRFGHRIFDALRSELDPCTSRLDCEGYATWADIEVGRRTTGSQEVSSLQSNSIDVLLGIHGMVNPDLLIGVAGNFTSTRLAISNEGHNTLYTGQGAMYASYAQTDFYLFSDLVVGGSFSKFKRPIHFGETDRIAHGKPTTIHGVWYGEAGLNFLVNNWVLQPFFGADVNVVEMQKTNESGAGSLNLDIAKRVTHNYHTYLGSHFTWNYNQCFTINGDLAWLHRFGSSASIKTKFAEFGNDFIIEGNDFGRDGLWGNINIETPLVDRINFYGDFSGEWFNQWAAYSCAIGINCYW